MLSHLNFPHNKRVDCLLVQISSVLKPLSIPNRSWTSTFFGVCKRRTHKQRVLLKCDERRWLTYTDWARGRFAACKLLAYWMLLALSSRLYDCPFGTCCRFGTEADTFFASAKFVMGSKWARNREQERGRYGKTSKSEAIKMLTFDHRWCWLLQHRWLGRCRCCCCCFLCRCCLLFGLIYGNDTFDFHFLQGGFDARFHLSRNHNLAFVNQFDHMTQHKRWKFWQRNWTTTIWPYKDIDIRV